MIHTFWIDHDPGNIFFGKAGALQARWDQMTAQMAMVQKRAEEVGTRGEGPERWACMAGALPPINHVFFFREK